jgi:hypothetical protein
LIKNCLFFRVNGKSYDLDWIREGHRTYPLMNRAPSYSALHILADHASKVAAFENKDLPEPNATRREKILENAITEKHIIITEDPNKPPASSPAIFGVSRKDLKRSIDLVTLHPHSKKKHYHLKPPPPPNMKIHHLYQTLNTKRPRKTFTKKASSSSKVKSSSLSSKQSSYNADEKHFDGAELQRHLTSQLMPPPMSPMKVSYTHQQQQQQQQQHHTPTKKETNMLKMNHQQLEPQAHYIPNNRLKNELLNVGQGRARSARASKSVNVPHKTHNYSQKYANGAGTRNNNMDHIPDPQIIFNTTSSKIDPPLSLDTAMPTENNEIDMSPAITSPLQLLSTAASCTPKLKVISPVNNQILQQQQQLQPSTSTTQLPTPNQLKSAHNQPTFKIIKPIIIKPTTSDAKSSPQHQQQQQQQQQSILSTAPSKLKIQKIQLVMNKNQDGTTASLSPSATIVSGKAGQLVLSGKGITNTYQVGSKSPYTILSSAKAVTTAPKVMVQTIERNFAQKELTENERIPENQRITENTPIDFLPASSTSAVATTNYPKVIIQKSVTSPKQIKLKLGPGSIMNSKIIKGPLPSNLKIQRNINTKGFTVLNTSQIVHLQSTSPASHQQPQSSASTTISVAGTTTSTSTTTTSITNISNESTKTDWEQELDDVNRTKENMERLSENNGALVAKKPRIEELHVDVLKQDSEVDESLVKSNTAVIYGELKEKFY